MSHRIVIVGGGAGGLELATTLGRSVSRNDAEVILVDAHLSHVWKPLLHEVAAGALDAARDELSYAAQARWHGFHFICGRMEGLDRHRRQIKLAPWVGQYSGVTTPAVELAYDTLVMAVGSIGNDFATPGVAEHCLFLDSTAQAEALRANLLERHVSNVAQGKVAPLRVVIVGGGATGVELSAELVDANRHLAYYRNSSTPGLDGLEVTLVEAGPRLLPALPERIGERVRRSLEQLGIRVLTGTVVSRADTDGLRDAEGRTIDADIMIWAAGVKAPAFLRDIDGLECNRAGQLVVHSTLQVTRDANIFALGDCAACPVAPGSTRNVAALAQAAHQQATIMAKNLQRRLRDLPLLDFTFQDRGTLVSIASHNAFGKVFGNRIIEGRLARLFYVSLYRMHQLTLYGLWRTAWLVLGDLLSRRSRPLLKLH